MCLVKGHNAVTPLRLEPTTPRSWVKHSPTEPLCSIIPISVNLDNNNCHLTLTMLNPEISPLENSVDPVKLASWLWSTIFSTLLVNTCWSNLFVLMLYVSSWVQPEDKVSGKRTQCSASVEALTCNRSIFYSYISITDQWATMFLLICLSHFVEDNPLTIFAKIFLNSNMFFFKISLIHNKICLLEAMFLMDKIHSSYFCRGTTR